LIAKVFNGQESFSDSIIEDSIINSIYVAGQDKRVKVEQSSSLSGIVARLLLVR